LEEIELADDELDEVSDEDEALIHGESFGNTDPHTLTNGAAPLPDHVAAPEDGAAEQSSGGVPAAGESLDRLGELSRPTGIEANVPSPFAEASSANGRVHFDAEQFDQETQDAFAALEAGSVEGGTPSPDAAAGVGAGAAGLANALRGSAPDAVDAGETKSGRSGRSGSSGDLVDLQSMLSDADLPAAMPWEDAQRASAVDVTHQGVGGSLSPVG